MRRPYNLLYFLRKAEATMWWNVETPDETTLCDETLVESRCRVSTSFDQTIHCQASLESFSRVAVLDMSIHDMLVKFPHWVDAVSKARGFHVADRALHILHSGFDCERGSFWSSRTRVRRSPLMPISPCLQSLQAQSMFQRRISSSLRLP